MTSNKLYVGGLPYSVTDAQLSELFAAHGTVESARVITDKFTGRSRGFGFVEMSSQSEAEQAIASLNGSQLEGRALIVNEARPQQQGSDRKELLAKPLVAGLVAEGVSPSLKKLRTYAEITPSCDCSSLVFLIFLTAAPDHLLAAPMASLQPVASGLIRPVAVEHSGDGSGRLFVIELDGRIRIIRDKKLLETPFLDLTDKVVQVGEGGLLGLAFHPDFKNNGRFFVNYTTTDGGGVQQDSLRDG